MPVLVTNADLQPGLEVALAIAKLGGEVRAYVGGSGDVARLRQAGVFVSVGTPDDEGRIESAMEQVHTVIHIEDPTVAASAEIWASRAATVLRAATGAGVLRIIARSVPGAGAAAADPLHAAAGAWELALAGGAVPSVVVRVALVDTDEVRDGLASTVSAAMRDTTVAPVSVEAFVEAVAALDDVRSTATTGHAVLHAEGVRQTLAAHLVAVTGDSLVGRRYVTAADVPLLVHAITHNPGPEPDTADLWTFTATTQAP